MVVRYSSRRGLQATTVFVSATTIIIVALAGAVDPNFRVTLLNGETLTPSLLFFVLSTESFLILLDAAHGQLALLLLESHSLLEFFLLLLGHLLLYDLFGGRVFSTQEV